MEFLQIKYVNLEIYLKEENPSGEEDINDNSHWLSIAEIILEENPDILSEDLNIFVNKIKNIFNKKLEIIKNILKISYDESSIKEFNECFNDDNSLTKINLFIKKYNIDKENAEIFGVLFNILTIIDYIILHINEPKLYNVVKLII
jgi:hypothetical protein